ncbi:MAG: hypothetical protein J5563_08270 [Clostridia bacterium]|nr:hypothetical protein [Clostridia bacterium]
MKKTIALFVSLALLVCALSSCQGLANFLKNVLDAYVSEETQQNGPETSGNAGTESAAHTHSAVSVPGKAATCTEEGLTDGEKCSECGEILVAQDVIPALGHDPVENPESYVHPTWDSDGKTEDTVCLRCGLIYNEGATIPCNYEKIIQVFFENTIHDGQDMPITDMSKMSGEAAYNLAFALMPYYGFSIGPYKTGTDELGIDEYEIPKDFFDQMTNAMFGCTFDNIPNYYPLAGTVAYFDFTGGFGGFDHVYRTTHYELVMGMAHISVDYRKIDTGTGDEETVGQFLLLAETNGDKLLIRSVDFSGKG